MEYKKECVINSALASFDGEEIMKDAGISKENIREGIDYNDNTTQPAHLVGPLTAFIPLISELEKRNIWEVASMIFPKHGKPYFWSSCQISKVFK